MTTTLTPIQTLYKGFLFRSRTEARHAVCMDALQVAYQYEIEGFDLDGLRYLPDFWLPDLGCYLEIKGEEPKPDEEKKARLLSLHSGHRVIIAVGSPWHDTKMSGYHLGIKTDCIRFPWAWYVCSQCNRAGLIDTMMFKAYREISILAPCLCESARPILRHTLLGEAFEEARQARFEMRLPELTPA